MNNTHPFNPRSDARKPQDQPGLGDDIPCEKCGAVALDTGLECDECGHDNYKAVMGRPFGAQGADMTDIKLPEPVAHGLLKPSGVVDHDLIGSYEDCAFWSRAEREEQSGWPITTLYTADQLREAIAAERETIAEQRLTIDALMVGMPDNGTTPVIRRIAALEAEVEHHRNDIHSCHATCSRAGCVNARLRVTLEHVDAGLRAAEEERDALRADAERLQALLRQCEWVWPRSNSSPSCPVCGEHRHFGHAPKCPMPAAIDTARSGEPT